MTTASGKKRSDSASRVIMASPQTIYQAFLDPEAVASWRPLLELVRNERIVERVEFESDDPAFAGAMTITTTLAAVSGGTEVSIPCENVPVGIGPSDHQAGLASTLSNLAAFTE